MEGEMIPPAESTAAADAASEASRSIWWLDASFVGGQVDGSDFARGITADGVLQTIALLRQIADALEGGRAIPQSVETGQRAAIEAWTEHRFTIVYCRKR